jgi:hypothetical protein
LDVARQWVANSHRVIGRWRMNRSKHRVHSCWQNMAADGTRNNGLFRGQHYEWKDVLSRYSTQGPQIRFIAIIRCLISMYWKCKPNRQHICVFIHSVVNNATE